MPPKATAAVLSSDSTFLSPGETKMLAVVCILLGDVPKVNFDEVAKACGIKYGRNARSSCKRLFDKIKAANPGVNVETAGSGYTVTEAAAEDGSEENEDVEAALPKRTARLAPMKTTTRAPVKKTVGKTTAPKKAVATKKAPVKKGTAGNGKAAAIKEDADDDEKKAEEEIDVAMKDGAGKVPTASTLVPSPTPALRELQVPVASDRLPEAHQSPIGIDAVIREAAEAMVLLNAGVSSFAALLSLAQATRKIPTITVDLAPAEEVVAEHSSAGVDIAQRAQLDDEASSVAAESSPAAEEPLTVATSVAVDALRYFVKEVLYMEIEGQKHAYRNQDILDAQSHGILLEHWILWKFENGIDRDAILGP